MKMTCERDECVDRNEEVDVFTWSSTPDKVSWLITKRIIPATVGWPVSNPYYTFQETIYSYANVEREIWPLRATMVLQWSTIGRQQCTCQLDIDSVCRM